MKKIMIFVIALFFIIGCNVVKNAQYRRAIIQDSLEIVRTRQVLEKQRLAEQSKLQVFDAKIADEKRNAELIALRNFLAKKQLPLNERAVYVPCFQVDTAMDVMWAIGISSVSLQENDAYNTAFSQAKANLMQLWAGAYKQGVKRYISDTHVAGGATKDMSRIQSAVFEASRNAINKYLKVSCQEMSQLKNGSYKCYMTVAVGKSTIKKAIADQRQSMEVDFNEERLWQEIDNELEKTQRHVADSLVLQ